MMSKTLITCGNIPRQIGENIKKYFSNFVSMEDHLGSPESLEKAEEKAQTLDLTRLFKEPENNKMVVFIIDGHEHISGCCLTVLEYFKNQNIQILYIKSDLEWSGMVEKINHKIVNQILQEKTRAGIFDNICFPVTIGYCKRNLQLNLIWSFRN